MVKQRNQVYFIQQPSLLNLAANSKFYPKHFPLFYNFYSILHSNFNTQGIFSQSPNQSLFYYLQKMFKICKSNRSRMYPREKPSSMPHRSYNFDFQLLGNSKQKITERKNPEFLSSSSQTTRFLHSSASRNSDRNGFVSSDNFYSLLKTRMTQKSKIYTSQKSLRRNESITQKNVSNVYKRSSNLKQLTKNQFLKVDMNTPSLTQEVKQCHRLDFKSRDQASKKRVGRSFDNFKDRHTKITIQGKKEKLSITQINKQNLQDSFNSSQQEKQQYCTIVIVMDNGQEKKQVQVRYKVKKIKGLVQFLKDYMKKFDSKFRQLNPDFNKDRQMVAFETVDYNLQLDYYLTLEKQDGSFLNGQTIELRPIYSVKQPVVNLNSFDIIQCIGSGGFSTVYLCRFKQNGKFYAMKVISKPFIVKNQKKKIVMNERNIMIQLRDKPNIAKLFYAFEAKQYIVFVMEYYEGGQLFNLVKRYRKMGEKTARFYITEVLLGLEKIHDNNIVYRDFKPQNIMIDIEGHAYIADFGLAKPNISTIDDRAYSFCGSPEYMPPEMIIKKGHSLPVDFYCLGALLYELVTGLPPFYNADPQTIYEGTLNEKLTFPDHAILTQELQNLLSSLLCKDQQLRLGSDFGVRQVLSHPWFRSIKIQDFKLKKVFPPVNFKRIQELRFNIDEMKEENQKQMKQILKKQKQQDSEKYLKIMNGFYYDYRLNEDTGESVAQVDPQKSFKKVKTQLSIEKTKNNSESIALTNCTKRSQNSLLLGNFQLDINEKTLASSSQCNWNSNKDKTGKISASGFIRKNPYFIKSKSPQRKSVEKRVLTNLSNFWV